MTDKDYLKLIIGHVGIGVLISIFPFLAKIYALLILIIGLYFVIKNKNKNHEVLYIAAYLVGSEVFLRTTQGNPFHEYGRYFVIFFMLLGLYYSDFSKKAYPYWAFLLCLIPGIFIAVNNLDSDVRKKIFFDILGPVCLGICALYTYRRAISRREIDNILLSIGLPVLACCTFLFLKYPLSEAVIKNTESQVFLSGDYAPNQMATTLGLGMFVFFLRFFLSSASVGMLLLNGLLFCFIYYRGLLTFSRGGMITAMAMVVILVIFILINYKKHIPVKLKLVFVSLAFPLIFVLGSCQTNGLLFKRYNNQNPSGLYKSYETEGRNDIALDEIKQFQKNPIVGVGVGKTKETRSLKQGSSISTHNEITRMLAEHGLFGIAGILILLFTPLFLFLKDKKNVYLLCLFAFWLLTINHTGMRVAAPSFIYALALLSLKKNPEINSV
ncbi:O-antigen ligase family protein [Flavobacterium sp. IMCC34852]|uniref:O-antigen ligase family protein n=1 Tax=Flavobacterium rivulicola TaxID=2732161 RepID=A0A7Y3R6B4_9FLAO|nr:O-antigen ligase family protein [Flavobacterium sp. IMCC34852]NNT70738.1 O-antigen ligase family protein [Flavobacterium sp. IMCC34852]